MRLYECIIEDSEGNVIKDYGTAKNKKELKEIYGGNGNFVRIRDITEGIFTAESIDKLYNTLTFDGWSPCEKKILCALLQEHMNNL